MKRTLITLAMCCALHSYYVDAQDESDVPVSAKHEIKRLGSFVNSVGEAHGVTVEDAIQEAFAPPKDDTYKWYFTLFVENKPGTKELTPACQAAKLDAETSEVFAPWINTIDRSKSAVHYNIRNLTNDADLHKDFTKNIRDQLSELPAVLIQPPRNGHFGKNESVVGIVSLKDYKHDQAETVVDTLRQIITNYITVKFNNGELKEFLAANKDGHAQGLEFMGEPSGKRSPYKVIPDGAANPKRLTMDDIEVLVPDAPRDFLQHCYRERLTSDEVLSQWNAHKKSLEKPDEKKLDSNDTPDFQEANHHNLFLEILVVLLLLGAAANMYLVIRSMQNGKGMRQVTEAEYKHLTDIVKRFDTTNGISESTTAK